MGVGTDSGRSRAACTNPALADQAHPPDRGPKLASGTPPPQAGHCIPWGRGGLAWSHGPGRITGMEPPPDPGHSSFQEPLKGERFHSDVLKPQVWTLLAQPAPSQAIADQAQTPPGGRMPRLYAQAVPAVSPPARGIWPGEAPGTWCRGGQEQGMGGPGHP